MADRSLCAVCAPKDRERARELLIPVEGERGRNGAALPARLLANGSERQASTWIFLCCNDRLHHSHARLFLRGAGEVSACSYCMFFLLMRPANERSASRPMASSWANCTCVYRDVDRGRSVSEGLRRSARRRRATRAGQTSLEKASVIRSLESSPSAVVCSSESRRNSDIRSSAALGISADRRPALCHASPHNAVFRA